MNEYRKFIHYLSSNNIDRVFLNSDEDKMLSVFIEMFKSAQKEFRLFSGSLTNDSVNTSEYIEALSDFIEKDGSALYILLNNYQEDKIKDSDLFRRLAYYQANGHNIILKYTTKELYFKGDKEKIPVHLAVGDQESFRLETNIEKRTAICNMHNPEIARGYISVFDDIFNGNDSTPIDLAEIFGLKEEHK